MRLLTCVISFALFTVLSSVLVLFIAQNLHHEEIAFFGLAYSTNLALLIAAAATVGFVLALLLLLPSRVAVGLYSRALYREAFQLEHRLALLLEQRDRWLDQHENVLDDREQMLQQFHRLLSERDRLLSEHNRLLMEHHSALSRLAALDPMRVVQAEVTARTSPSADTFPTDSGRGTPSPDVVVGTASKSSPKSTASVASAQFVYP